MGFAERWKGSMSCTFKAEKCWNAPVFGTLIHRSVIVFVPEICTLEYILEIFKCLFLLCLGAYKGTDSSLFPISLTPLSEGGQCCKGMHVFSWKTWNRAPPEFVKMPRWSTQWAFLTSPYITQIQECCWMLLVTFPMVGFSSKGTQLTPWPWFLSGLTRLTPETSGASGLQVSSKRSRSSLWPRRSQRASLLAGKPCWRDLEGLDIYIYISIYI